MQIAVCSGVLWISSPVGKQQKQWHIFHHYQNQWHHCMKLLASILLEMMSIELEKWVTSVQMTVVCFSF